MKNFLAPVLLFTIFSTWAQEEKPKIFSKEVQIKTAVLPAPENKRANAAVFGYNKDGDLVVLRKGTNNLVCLADNPFNEGISVSCYFKGLEPFMKRGRELRKQGMNMKEIRKIRSKEVAEGTLIMPNTPSMMYVYFGSEASYNETTAVLKDGTFRYVIYTPFATSESTGLPIKPHAKGMPWIMDPGTHRAHIMIGPN